MFSVFSFLHLSSRHLFWRHKLSMLRLNCSASVPLFMNLSVNINSSNPLFLLGYMYMIKAFHLSSNTTCTCMLYSSFRFFLVNDFLNRDVFSIIIIFKIFFMEITLVQPSDWLPSKLIYSQASAYTALS